MTGLTRPAEAVLLNQLLARFPGYAAKFVPAEVLKRALFVGAGKPPAVPVFERPAAVLREIPEQIFKTVLPGERVAFQV